MRPVTTFNLAGKLTGKLTGLVVLCCLPLCLSACQQQPPSERPEVTIAPYSQGDIKAGQQAYERDCAKCHRLQAGKNEKGPQLMRVYGAKAALLADYHYSEGMKNSQLIWTADNLDKLIANPKQLVPNTRMKTDPISDSQKRQNIIAYLSSLR